MNKLLLASTFLFLPMISSGSDLLKYDEPVSIYGTLSSVRSNHPNPDFRGKNQPTILLDKPVSMIGDDNNEFNAPEENVRQIQLAYDKKSESFISKNNGKKVIAKCNDLFHAHTAHHTTKVLCDLESIRIAN